MVSVYTRISLPLTTAYKSVGGAPAWYGKQSNEFKIRFGPTQRGSTLKLDASGSIIKIVRWRFDCRAMDRISLISVFSVLSVVAMVNAGGKSG